MGFPGGSEGKESACSAGDLDSIPGLGRSPAEGNCNSLQHSCLENLKDREAWWSIGLQRVGRWSDLACTHMSHCTVKSAYCFPPYHRWVFLSNRSLTAEVEQWSSIKRENVRNLAAISLAGTFCCFLGNIKLAPAPGLPPLLAHPSLWAFSFCEVVLPPAFFLTVAPLTQSSFPPYLCSYQCWSKKKLPASHLHCFGGFSYPRGSF